MALRQQTCCFIDHAKLVRQQEHIGTIGIPPPLLLTDVLNLFQSVRANYAHDIDLSLLDLKMFRRACTTTFVECKAVQVKTGMPEGLKIWEGRRNWST